MVNETTTSSIRISPKIWEDFKIWCIKNHTSISEKLEELIREVLKNDKN